MKRTAMALSACLLLTCLPITAEAQVASTSKITRGETVDYLLQSAKKYDPNLTKSNLIKGDAAGSLRENQPVSRLEALLMISRAFPDLPKPQGNDLRIGDTKAVFKDVPVWAQHDLAKLVSAGVVSGYSNEKLGASDKVTKEQLQTLTKRIFALEGSNPKDDLYEFVNKKWLNDSVLPVGAGENSAVAELTAKNDEKLKLILQELVKAQHTPGSVEQKLADFYSAALDKDSRNKQGVQPITPYLTMLDKASNLKELLAADTAIFKATDIGSLVPITFGQGGDNNQMSLYFLGLGTGLRSDSYFSKDDKAKNLYIEYLKKLYMLSGDNEQSALSQAKLVFELEASLTEGQDDTDSNTTNRTYSKDQFTALFKTVDMVQLLKERKFEQADSIIVQDIRSVDKVNQVLTESNLDSLKAYAKSKLLIGASSMLSDDFKQAAIQFYADAYGMKTAEKSNEQNAFELTKAKFGDYLGQMFADKYVPEKSKSDVEQMVKQYISIYKQKIGALDWMSEATKTKAIKKLDSMKLKIGYPDPWNSLLDSVTIRSYKDGGSHFANMVGIRVAEHGQKAASLGKVFDDGKWQLDVYDVNAMYLQDKNEILVPAGIMQAPFYDPKFKLETNLGGIGTIIAHEITHAFDTTGANFDESGNQKKWWAPADYKKFEARCQQVIAAYDHIEVLPGVYNSGQVTLNENIADNGGMATSLQVASQLDHPDYKAFFESWATIWRSTRSKDMAASMTKMDMHSANKIRVNRTVANFPEFYKAYGITDKDAMYIAPEKRVHIW